MACDSFITIDFPIIIIIVTINVCFSYLFQVITYFSSVFADDDISIEALIQHEARKLPEDTQDTVPVVIISGSVSDELISRLIENLESMKEIEGKVRQFRIHNAI